MITRVLAIVAILGVVASASQPPAPGGRKREGDPPQQQSNPAQDKTAPATPPTLGTEATPAIVRVAKTPQETEQEQRDREQEAANKRWMIGLTGFTVLVLLFQLGVLHQQNRIMTKQSAIMRRQRAAAVAQTGHMADGLLETRKAVEAATVSAEAAKASADALKIVHRQWLRIMQWEVSIAPLGNAGEFWATFHVQINNTSNLPLTIRTVRCYVNGRKGGHQWSNAAVGPGEARWEDFFSTLTEDERVNYDMSGRRITFVVAGWIEYWDAFNEPQQQIIGAHLAVAPGMQLQVRGLADPPRNLARMMRIDPWPLDEPDPTAPYD